MRAIFVAPALSRSVSLKFTLGNWKNERRARRAGNRRVARRQFNFPRWGMRNLSFRPTDKTSSSSQIKVPLESLLNSHRYTIIFQETFQTITGRIYALKQGVRDTYETKSGLHVIKADIWVSFYLRVITGWGTGITRIARIILFFINLYLKVTGKSNL